MKEIKMSILENVQSKCLFFVLTPKLDINNCIYYIYVCVYTYLYICVYIYTYIFLYIAMCVYFIYLFYIFISIKTVFMRDN